MDESSWTGLRGCAWGWMRSGVGRVPVSDGPLAQELCSAVEQDNAALQKEKEETEQRIRQVKNTKELIQENLQQHNPLEDLIQTLQVGARRNRLRLGKVAAGGWAHCSAGTGTQQGVRGAARGGLCWKMSSCWGGRRMGCSGKPGAVSGLQGVKKKIGVVGAESERLDERAA